jgi:ectoine hydroxylase-related dioxygenase (phytanoyl-CoA dioxygenase family)
VTRDFVPLHPPTLDATYIVTPEQIQQYRENGHVLLRDVMTPEEVEIYRGMIKDTALKHVQETRPLEERDTYGKAFLQITNIWELSQEVRRFVVAPRFGRIIAELTGRFPIRVYHDQALFKEPGGGPTPWHQDQYYWPLEAEMATIWVPLVDVSPEMGTMSFADGSHREGYLGPIPISDESEETFRRFIEEKGYNITQTPAMKAGDATVHAGWTLHSAGGNNTDAMREVMTVIYYPSDAKIIEPDHEDRVRDLERWFPDQKPGEVAGTLINPWVWP